MLRNLCKVISKNNTFPQLILKHNYFLSNGYKCVDAWNSQSSSSLLSSINLNDFYNNLDQNYSSKGVISAIDVDIFANALKDPIYLEELRDLLYKLRLTADTGNMLESTHHATVRNYIAYDNITELIDILNNPLQFGVFLDNYTANILLDTLLNIPEYELAANVASLVMLQEDFTNSITCALSQYASYKYIETYVPKASSTPAPEEKKQKVEEIKIRIKFLRNPYFDDHFDITDQLLKSGKTLAWISEIGSDNLNNNLKIIGWLFYEKYETVLKICKTLGDNGSIKIFPEVLQMLHKKKDLVQDDIKLILEKCISLLSKVEQMSPEINLENTIKIAIENAINKCQNNDVSAQVKLFQSWAEIREQKLAEQTKRVDRIRRLQVIQEKQTELEEQENKLWFFENEYKIDLEIEEKEKLMNPSSSKERSAKTVDENYIPPEIVRKRK